jgi:polyphosphate kinase
LDRRVELLFPIENEKAKLKVKAVLKISLKDTMKARILNSDGSYSRIDKRGKESINSQEVFVKIELDETKAAEKFIQSMKKQWAEEGFKPVYSDKMEQYTN